MDLVERASPEISDNPLVVKYIKGGIFRNCYFNDGNLSLYPPIELINVEKMLRSSGYYSPEKIEVAEILRGYLMMTAPFYGRRIERGMEVVSQPPTRPQIHSLQVERAWLFAIVCQEIEDLGETSLKAGLAYRETEDDKPLLNADVEELPEKGEIYEE